MKVALDRCTANTREKDNKLEEEDEDELFREIWERESQQELRFPVPGAGQVRLLCRMKSAYDLVVERHV